MSLGLKIDYTSVFCEHVEVFKQVQSPCFIMFSEQIQCFSFHDSVNLFCRCKLPACIGHWVPVVIILLQESSSKRHVTIVSVNSERLRYISKMQNRSGYQRRLDIFKGLLSLFVPEEYAVFQLFDPEVSPVQRNDKQIFENNWQIQGNSSPDLQSSVRAKCQQPVVSFDLEQSCFQ